MRGRWLAGVMALAATVPGAMAQKMVTTEAGVVASSKVEATGVTAFKGIPYAAPPVGELRWRAPQNVAAWKGVRTAEEFGASCMQRKDGERLPWSREFLVQNAVSEDCLYLNVWTPQTQATAKLPVIVYIHGGGFSEGSGGVAVYDGASLAARGAVVVTINYRLGVFGFLAHRELSAESAEKVSGNYGLLDQQAALGWVKRNIAGFGGDPGRVLIWGQSAGAFSVGDLVASPLSKGLFSAAMADSGLSHSAMPMMDLATAEKVGASFAEEHQAKSLKELRGVPAEALLPGAGEMGMRFAPIVDGVVLPDTPNALNAAGRDQNVPLVTGFQANDGAMFLPPLESYESYQKLIARQYVELATEFAELYPARTLAEGMAALRASIQDRDKVSMYLWARERAKSHTAAVYTYFFTRAIPWPQHPEFGAFHTGEIPYLFGNLKQLDRPWTAEDRRLAEETGGYLLNFAASGSPNAKGLPEWPKVSADRAMVMQLDAESVAVALASDAREKFWMKYFATEAGKNAPPF